MRRTLTALVLGAVTIALAACGGSGSDGGELSPSATVSPRRTATAGPTRTPVRSPPATPDCTQAGSPIQVVDVTTGEMTVVAYGGAPVWSPDGERLALMGPDRTTCDKSWILYVLDLTTGATKAIYDPPSGNFRWSWSPDGASIAVAVTEGGVTAVEGRVELVDVEIGDVTEIFQGRAASSPVWSADGERLAFAGQDDQGTWFAQVIDTTTRDTVEIVAEGERTIGRVTLSPDGGNLAFVEVEEDIKGNSVRQFLHVGPVEGEPVLVLETEWFFDTPVWSADGATVAIVDSTSIEFDLYTVHANGSGLQYIANGTAPSWAPDANVLAFAGDPCGERDVSAIAADGSGPRTLAPDLDGFVRIVRWSPVGDLIAFVVEGGMAPGVYVVKPDGSGLKLLLDSMYSATWAPDGSRLIGLPAGGRGFCH